MGRRQKDPKPTQPTASAEKRSRPNRNPLRRGPSSRDMQTIPSPEESILHLPSRSPRQEPASSPRATKASAVEQPRPPVEPQRATDQPNGDTIMPAPLRPSDGFQTNGVKASRDLAPTEPQPSPAPPAVTAEVSTVKFNWSCSF